MTQERLAVPFLDETRKSIMISLLGKDANSVELARKIGINESVIRRHLEALEKEGLAFSRFERHNRGRPKRFFPSPRTEKHSFLEKGKYCSRCWPRT